MIRRNKSRFEKWFSFSRHKRRLGSQKLSDQIFMDFDNQKKKIIGGGNEGDKKIYTHGSANNIEDHFVSLKNEFIGQDELCYTHAKIIVLIRRDFQANKHFSIFEQLWHKEEKHLLKNLNTRWLIAATDTFSDYSDDDIVRGLSVACACLFNTIKIQETERLILNSMSNTDNEDQSLMLKNQRIALFDGTSAFAVGTDDTLRNMRWRIDKMAKINVAGKILLEIFVRLQQYDTVYKRFKDRHTREKTSWW